ncbi:MAG: Cu(I)-responsive transcriptional regulator [Neisseria sp.]|uniref:Cu(I)-responsive transcriptional regulator n=1 Tax=Neisseria sp. TaxID=192066 RepID=UPI0026DCF7D7|nr:Cu(I)-responsive transcriptional regulator [Neisseria sp.]MDO4641647.1 Cu(I)-responsive transcriptional regulator [Neisseria sp.]
MMNISEAARQTGLSAKQIRDYEKYGLLTAARRTEGGYRAYQENDLKRLKFIRHARDVGFSLQQIAELLKLNDSPKRSSRAVKTITARHIDELEKQIQTLQNMVEKLRQWHDVCKGDDCPQCTILEGLEK